MGRSFADLSAEAEQSWSADTRDAYEAASQLFEYEMQEKARLGALLRSKREAMNLTQPALAALADVQQAEISRIERGISNPTESTLIRLMRVLRVRLSIEDVATA